MLSSVLESLASSEVPSEEEESRVEDVEEEVVEEVSEEFVEESLEQAAKLMVSRAASANTAIFFFIEYNILSPEISGIPFCQIVD